MLVLPRTSGDDCEDLHASIFVTLSLTAKQDDGPGLSEGKDRVGMCV